MKLFCLAIIFELHSSNLPKFEESNSNLDNYLHSPGVPFLPDFGCAGSLSDAIVVFWRDSWRAMEARSVLKTAVAYGRLPLGS